MHSVPLRRNELDKETPGWECGRAVLQLYALFSQDLQASGNIEGEKKKIWHRCKNSLELIRQSMHIFTNIWRGDGAGREKYII